VPNTDEEALSLLDGYTRAEAHAAVYEEWRWLGAGMMAALIRAGEAAEEGGGEYAGAYDHDHEPPTPGSKGRTRAAARMVQKALEAVLEGLGTGSMGRIRHEHAGARGQDHR
jgi:hypothetical protein